MYQARIVRGPHPDARATEGRPGTLRLMRARRTCHIIPSDHIIGGDRTIDGDDPTTTDRAERVALEDAVAARYDERMAGTR